MASGEIKVVVSRKDRVCSEHSYHRIQKGDRYLLMVMAPWHEMSDGKKWLRRTVCLRCAEEYGMHTNETRKQLETKM